MVDALEEIWRSLASGGTLVDLRPVSSLCPIEVVTSEKVIQVGEADGTGMAADDAAADRAVGDVVERGWLVPGRRLQFSFDFYWDGIGEMESFVADSVRMKNVAPPFADLEKAVRELDETEPYRTRIRCRRETMLAVYRKAPPHTAIAQPSHTHPHME